MTRHDMKEKIRENPHETDSYAKLAYEQLGDDTHDIEMQRFQRFCARSDTITRYSDARKWARRFRRGTEFQDMDRGHKRLMLKIMMDSHAGWAKHFDETVLEEVLEEVKDDVVEDLDSAEEVMN